MCGLAVVGWPMLSAGGCPIALFGTVHLPPLGPVDPTLFSFLRRAHTLLAFLLFLTILAHLGAALFHAWIRRDGVFRSMVPWRQGCLFVLAIGKSRVAQTGADREYAPVVDVLHLRDLAQALDHRVVVHDHDRLMTFEARQPPGELGRELEVLAFPVARQILAALHYDATLVPQARTADTEERCELDLLPGGKPDQLDRHRRHALRRLIARRFVVAMPPMQVLPHLGLRQVTFLQDELDNADSQIAAADVGGEDRVMTGQHPARRKLHRADQAGLVGMLGDGAQLDLDVLAGQQYGGTAHRQLADVAGA